MFLLDTNVISEVTRAAPNPRVMTWLASQERVTLSVISLSELEYGVDVAPRGQQDALREWLDELRRTAQFLPVTAGVAEAAGLLRAACQRQGKALTLADGLIAATAVVTKRTLVTRNVKDFTACEITTLDPWRQKG